MRMQGGRLKTRYSRKGSGHRLQGRAAAVQCCEWHAGRVRAHLEQEMRLGLGKVERHQGRAETMERPLLAAGAATAATQACLLEVGCPAVTPCLQARWASGLKSAGRWQAGRQAGMSNGGFVGLAATALTVVVQPRLEQQKPGAQCNQHLRWCQGK